MIKDLSEAAYYCTIVKAMEDEYYTIPREMYYDENIHGTIPKSSKVKYYTTFPHNKGDIKKSSRLFARTFC